MGERSLSKVWLGAVVAQGGWVLAGLRPDSGTILFAFAVSGQALRIMQAHGPGAWPLSLMLVLAWLPFSDASYGIAGVMMLLLACGVFMTGRRTTRTGLACCLALTMLALNAGNGSSMAIAGLIIPGVVLTVLSRTCSAVPRFWPRQFFPLFYAVHLAALGLIAM